MRIDKEHFYLYIGRYGIHFEFGQYPKFWIVISLITWKEELQANGKCHRSN